MTQSFVLMPVPKWYIADLSGLPLGSGYLAAFSSLNPVSDRDVFMTADGSLPWPRVAIPNTSFTGILFDENGSQGPFYFLFDSTTPSNLYYLAVYDFDGVLQWDINDFNPSQGGGGGIITTANNIQNQVTNSPMWRHTIGVTPVVTTSTQFLIIAPGAHAGLSNDVILRPVTSADYTGGDIVFLKNNTTATDSISFPLFTPLGVNNFGLDAQPPDYFHYECSGAGSSENTKCVQFPILNNVANLSNKSVVIKVWAKSASSNNFTLKWKQFYGDGGGSASVNSTITTFSLTPVWGAQTITTVIPDITGKTLGSCGNSGLFLQIEMPHDVTSSIDFTIPRIYLGTSVPAIDFENYDVIDSQINTPRTGDVKVGYATSIVPGYLLMDDKTIGSPNSGATSNGGVGANANTFPLFNLLWTNVSNAFAPVSGGRGASAVADFTANKTLTLTRQLGRVIGAAGAGSGLTSRALGEFLGSQDSVVVAHSHEGNAGRDFILSAPGGPVTLEGSGGAAWGRNIRTASEGITGVGANMQPSSFANFFIKL